LIARYEEYERHLANRDKPRDSDGVVIGFGPHGLTVLKGGETKVVPIKPTKGSGFDA